MKLERLIGVVLRAGVMVSSTCLAVGLLLSLATGDHAMAAVLLNVGIVVLLATPLARVIVSTVQYVGERDWLFATLTVVCCWAGERGRRSRVQQQGDLARQPAGLRQARPDPRDVVRLKLQRPCSARWNSSRFQQARINPVGACARTGNSGCPISCAIARAPATSTPRSGPHAPVEFT
jgi:uncharacterized membrane protein